MANLGIQNNNPGNIKDPTTGTFRVFNTPQEGQQALLNDLKIKTSGRSSVIKPDASLSQLAAVWAPASDKNDPVNYANTLSKTLGVPVNTPIKELSNRLPDLANAISTAEGTTTLMKNPQPQNLADGGNTSPLTQIKPKLTHDQMITNINAMEAQGAKPEEVQGYLNSLKQQNLAVGGGVSDLSQSNQQGDNQKGFFGENTGDSTLGKLADNSLTRGLINLVPGAKTLGQSIGTLGGFVAEKLKGAFGGQDNSANYDLSAPSPLDTALAGVQYVGTGAAVQGAGGLLGKVFSPGSAFNPVLGGAKALTRAVESPIIQNAIESAAGNTPVSEMSAAQQLKAVLDAADESHQGLQPLFQQAVEELKQQVLAENNVAPLAQQTIPKGMGLLTKAGIGLGGLVGTGIANATYGNPLGKFYNSLFPQKSSSGSFQSNLISK